MMRLSRRRTPGSRSNDLGSAARAVRDDEAGALSEDAHPGDDRLERGPGRSDPPRRLIAIVSTVVVVVAAAVSGLAAWNQYDDASTQPSPPPNDAPRPAPAVATWRPFVVDVTTSETDPLPRSVAPNSLKVSDLPFALPVHYAVSPDGKWLAYSTCHRVSVSDYCSADDVIGVADLDGSEVRRLHLPTGLNGYEPQWSPDGTRLVYQIRHGGSGDVGDLVVEDLATGRRTQITHLGRHFAWSWSLSASFSPDGGEVLFQLPRSGSADTAWDVWSVPVSGGEPSLVVPDARSAVYLPDGRRIAFVHQTSALASSSSIQVIDESGTRSTLATDVASRGFSLSPDGSRIVYGTTAGVIAIVDVESAGRQVLIGDAARWIDDHRLLITPGR